MQFARLSPGQFSPLREDQERIALELVSLHPSVMGLWRETVGELHFLITKYGMAIKGEEEAAVLDDGRLFVYVTLSVHDETGDEVEHQFGVVVEPELWHIAAQN